MWHHMRRPPREGLRVGRQLPGVNDQRVHLVPEQSSYKFSVSGKWRFRDRIVRNHQKPSPEQAQGDKSQFVIPSAGHDYDDESPPH